MKKITRRSVLRLAAGATAATVLTPAVSAAQVPEARQGDLRNPGPNRHQIAAVRYAPPDRYIKDHCLIRKDGLWHLFGPLGKVGTSWEDLGSEETAEHMTSPDLIHWTHLGTAVAASAREGHFDKTMGGIAPHVIPHGGEFFMFYAGWTFPSKRPNFNLAGYQMRIGLAKSRDLLRWEKPPELAREGLGVLGTDQCVVRDEAKGRWLMMTWTGETPVYRSADLVHWSRAGTALTSADLGGVGESPFVLRHPRSGQWMILFNHGYSVSGDPLKFPRVRPYSFKSGWHQPSDVKPTGTWGDGTNMLADDDGAGFAHEVVEFGGQWYLTGVVGRDGRTKLKFTPIEWTEDSLRLAQ